MTGLDVLVPSSPEEAVAAYGDGDGVTVIAGGTIVLPEITYGRLRPSKAILLKDAGLAGITRDGSRVTIGATTPVVELTELPAPIGPCAANVADSEIRAQGTVGGNLCAGIGPEAPRGDLQGALLAVGATVRTGGSGGEKTQPLEEFLADREGKLLLDVSYDEPAAGAFASLDRPHTHDYTALAVSAARAEDGTTRLAVSGVAGHAVRLPSAEAKADNPQAAGEAAAGDATFADDALASAWYRGQTLPVLVRRALTQLQEA
ncbi:MAG: FAD binding domain-containing protein [Actinobacteria bacterium]|nr:FAD binding domain-containing protein [Actinomycetota bacterium]